jgi:hypothetical protein
MTFPLNKKQIFLLVLVVLSTLPFFIDLNSENEISKKEYELFDPKLSSICTLHEVILYNDSLVRASGKYSPMDTTFYVESLSDLIKTRFKHGLANYSLSNNWIAFVSSKLLWSHFSAIVDANDILKHEEGLCSQQTIVFLEALRTKNIPARSVGLGKKEGPGHFIAEVKIDGGWHIYDVSLEPDWSKLNTRHQSMEYYVQNTDSLFKVYQNRMSVDMFNTLIKKIDYGQVGAFPAKKMYFFHAITYVLTLLLPTLFLFLFIRSLYKKNRK